MAIIKPAESWTLDHIFALYEATHKLAASETLTSEELCTVASKSEASLLKAMSKEELQNFCSYIAQRIEGNRVIFKSLMEDYKIAQNEPIHDLIIETLEKFFFLKAQMVEEEDLPSEIGTQNSEVPKSGKTSQVKEEKKVVKKVSTISQTLPNFIIESPTNSHQTIRRRTQKEVKSENNVVNIPVITVRQKLNVIKRFPHLNLADLVKSEVKLTELYNLHDLLECKKMSKFAWIYKNIIEDKELKNVNEYIDRYFNS